MYYTMNPLPNPADNHSGYLLVSIMCIIIAIVCIKHIIDYELRNSKIVIFGFVVTLCVNLFSAYISFFSPKHNKAPLNEPVTAYLVDSFESEVKGSKGRITPKMFVVYKTPDGEVTFPRNTGEIYPKEAILYKNEK